MRGCILITGAAGFIGFSLALRLLGDGSKVIGVDNMNDYYDVSLKRKRQAILSKFPNYSHYEEAIEDQRVLDRIFNNHKPRFVFHLAAQAGVRHSIEFPEDYVSSNLIGTFNILELCKKYNVKHLIAASTSSVYGESEETQNCESTSTSYPISFYAATKKATEVMAHSYSHLFSIPITMVRFFTVYGPWGRPDMALFKFTKNIIEGKPIHVFNNGVMSRDFTYIDDLTLCLKKLISVKPQPGSKVTEHDNISHNAPFRSVNIGSSNPVRLMDYIKAIENAIGKKAILNFEPLQAGDIPDTHANNEVLYKLISYRPSTTVASGVENFVKWYKSNYDVS